MKQLFLFAIAAICFASCVSNKKYMAAQDKISSLRRDSSSLESQVADAKTRISQLESKVNQLQATNSFTSGQLDESQSEIARQKERLQQLQTLIDQQKAATEALRSKIAEAMKGFSSDQLTVFTKNGRVYVSMQESLLFPSGSAEVNVKGKEALGTLAQALNQNPDINVMVEGHTDSIPITKRYEDNWALGAARATAITRVLIKDYLLAPTRIIASSRSQYDPVADNGTPEGRSKNRRTEIILEPKLDELMQLIRGGGTPQ